VVLLLVLQELQKEDSKGVYYGLILLHLEIIIHSAIPELCDIRKGIYKMALSTYTSESWFWSFVLMHISILVNLSDNTST